MDQSCRNWKQSKRVLIKAIQEGHRVTQTTNGSCSPENWIKSGNYTFREKVEIYKIYIKGAEGSYSDLIMPELGELIDLYHGEITSKGQTELSRLKLFREEVNVLLNIFGSLDKEIASFRWEKFSEKGMGYYGKFPALIITGLDLKGRTANNFHSLEISQLKQINTELGEKGKKKLFTKEYLGYLSTFSNNLGWALRYTILSQVQICSWEHTKPAIEKAVKMGYRVDLQRNDLPICWPEDFIESNYTFSVKVEMYKLFITGVYGAYSDLVMTQIGELIGLYNSEIIRDGQTDEARLKFFREELNTLIEVFQSLDKQIEGYIKFKREVEKKFDKYLNKTLGNPPTEADRETYWPKFIDQNKKYGESWPGFMTSMIEDDLAQRLEDNFHLLEISHLKKGLENLREKDKLSVKEYKDILYKSKIFTDNLGWAFSYCPSCINQTTENTPQ